MIRRILAVAAASMLGVTAAAAQMGGMGGMGGWRSDSIPSMGMARGMMMSGMMGQGMMGQGMMGMMGQGMGMMATGGPGPTAILRLRDALQLTDEQVTRLEKIQQDFWSTVQPQMTAMMSSHGAAARALQGESPDFDAYQQELQAAANIMVQTHVAMARAHFEARGVLTPEQREHLDSQGAHMMQGVMRGYGWSDMMGR